MDATFENDRAQQESAQRKRRRKRFGPPVPPQTAPTPIKKRNMYMVYDEDYIKDKLRCIREPTYDLEPICYRDIKFQSRSRLYITNIPSNITEAELKELFKPYGDVDDTYINPNIYAFIRFDYFHNAVKAIHALNNTVWKDKTIRIRHSLASSIIVKNLPPFISNELVHLAFSVFGAVDYCAVLTDKAGQSLNEAVVDFNTKRSSKLARKYCNENYYLLNSYMRPVFVDECEIPYHSEGLPEEHLKKSREYYQSREKGPRFAIPDTFEFTYATRYKDIYVAYEMKKKELETMIQEEERLLLDEVIEAKFDYETEKLKEILQEREREREMIRRRREGLPLEDERDWIRRRRVWESQEESYSQFEDGRRSPHMHPGESSRRGERISDWRHGDGPGPEQIEDSPQLHPGGSSRRDERMRDWRHGDGPARQEPGPEPFEPPKNLHELTEEDKKKDESIEPPVEQELSVIPALMIEDNFIDPNKGFNKNNQLYERRSDIKKPGYGNNGPPDSNERSNRTNNSRGSAVRDPSDRFREREMRDYRRPQADSFNNSRRPPPSFSPPGSRRPRR